MNLLTNAKDALSPNGGKILIETENINNSNLSELAINVTVNLNEENNEQLHYSGH